MQIDLKFLDFKRYQKCLKLKKYVIYNYNKKKFVK